MKKKWLTFVLALVLVVACAFNVIACGNDSSSASKDGTYYLYTDSDYDTENYIKITDGKVSKMYMDGESASAYGKLTSSISGSKITLTLTATEAGTTMKEVYSGTIKSGVINITLVEEYIGGELNDSYETDIYFCKKGKTPDSNNNGDDDNNNETPNTPTDLTPEGFVPSNYPADNYFQGSISQDSYATKNEAAQAFLEIEVSGEATRAEFRSYAKTETVSIKEAENFGLSADEASRVTSIEKGEIEYVDGSSASARNASRASDVVSVKVKKITLYIIVIDMSEYKYFAPELNKGDIITKSYYDEVFDLSKYTNCTIEEESVITTKMKQSGYNMTVDISTVAEMYISQYAMYARLTMTTDYHGLMENDTTYMEVYMEYVDSYTTNAYARVDNGGWYNGTAINANDYILPKMDNSFFIKTDYGFTVNSEKFSLYIQKQANEALGNSGLNINYDSLTATVAYLVKDGRMDKIKATLDGEYTANGINGTVSAVTTDQYSGFGTTVVPTKTELGINY